MERLNAIQDLIELPHLGLVAAGLGDDVAAPPWRP